MLKHPYLFCSPNQINNKIDNPNEVEHINQGGGILSTLAAIPATLGYLAIAAVKFVSPGIRDKIANRSNKFPTRSAYCYFFIRSA